MGGQIRRGRTNLFLSLLRAEATVLRDFAMNRPRPGAKRLVYQGLIALVRPVTLWLKWESQGLSGSHFVAVNRTELLENAVKRGCQAEAKFGPGLWLEFGVYRGETLHEIAAMAPTTVYGFDSFEGLPDYWGPGHPRGTFAVRGQFMPMPKNVELVPGLFEKTVPAFLGIRAEQHATFVHVDCDLYSSARTVLRYLQGFLREGSVMVFDEFCGLVPDDEARAFREFLRESGCSFHYLGVSYHGSVLIEIGPSRANFHSGD